MIAKAGLDPIIEHAAHPATKAPNSAPPAVFAPAFRETSKRHETEVPARADLMRGGQA